MSDDIQQTFSLDASQAISALKSLDSSFSQLQQRLQGVAQDVRNFDSAVGGSFNALNASFSNVVQSSQQFDGAMGQATRSTNGFGVSLETLTRVVATQAIVRGLSAIRDAAEGSFQGFIEFNRAVAEVQTIAGNTSLDDLSKQIADFAGQFNIPLLQAAKGQYQALSNGFTNLADATAVSTAAAKLNKVGISSQAEAIDTLSTVLNSYKLNADQAAQVGGKLVQSVIDGRQTIDQLSSAVGRVAPLASQLGVSFDELLASFSSITQGGSSVSEAATQIRGVLSALVKPSTDLEEAYKQLGVASGEQLVAAKGLAGAQQAIISTTDGSTASIAKLFPNVRALTGVLRENGPAADTYVQHLASVQQAGAKLLNQKYTLRVGSDTEQLDNAINRIKVFFTSDIGKQLTGGAAKAINFAGVDNVITGLQAIVPVMGAVTLAVTAYGVAWTAARVQQDLAALSAQKMGANLTTLRGAIGVVTAAFAAYEAGTAIGQGITRYINSDRDAALKAQQQLLESQRDAVSQQQSIDAAADSAKQQLVNSSFLELRKSYTDQLTEARTTNDELISDDQSTLNRIISAHSQYATDLKRLNTQANNDAVNATRSANALQGTLQDQRFNYAISRTNEFNQAMQASRRAQQLSAQAAGQLSSAHTQPEQQLAQNTFARAEAYANMAVQVAKATGSLGLQAQAEQTLEGITRQRISAENALSTTRKVDADRLAKADGEEKQRIQELRTLADDFVKQSNAFDKNGAPLPTDQLKGNLAKAKSDLQQFLQLSAKQSPISVTDLLSFDKLSTRLSEAASGTELKQLKAAPTALDSLFNQIQGTADKHAILVSFATDSSKLKGTILEQLDEVQRQINAGGVNLANQRNAGAANTNGNATIDAARTEASRSYFEQPGTTENVANNLKSVLSQVGGGQTAESIQLQQQLLQQLRQEIQFQIQKPNVQPEDINRISGGLTGLQKNGSGVLATGLNRAGNELNQLVAVFNEQQAQLQRVAEGLNPAALSRAVDDLQANVERASAAIGNLSPKPAAERAFGGSIFLATGGIARGTDTVPAMLSPGETVINASSSRKFFSQLQSIQSGQAPVNRQQGGTVIHNTVGDINVRSTEPKLAAQEMQGRVLHWDNELRGDDLANRYQRQADALGLDWASVAGNIDIVPLRGRQATLKFILDTMATLGNRYVLTTIDAFYKCLGGDVDENSNSDMAAALVWLDTLSERHDCGTVFVHHFSKGSQANKATTDLGLKQAKADRVEWRFLRSA
ncbi:MAG TPA: phage tail tape measure protein [Pirellulales bacterium]|jgi:TP901 family phage tail tape measure protein|nr:phage tail tape measure protein [Pirellulales bacterium]